MKISRISLKGFCGILYGNLIKSYYDDEIIHAQASACAANGHDSLLGRIIAGNEERRNKS